MQLKSAPRQKLKCDSRARQRSPSRVHSRRLKRRRRRMRSGSALTTATSPSRGIERLAPAARAARVVERPGRATKDAALCLCRHHLRRAYQSHEPAGQVTIRQPGARGHGSRRRRLSAVGIWLLRRIEAQIGVDSVDLRVFIICESHSVVARVDKCGEWGKKNKKSHISLTSLQLKGCAREWNVQGKNGARAIIAPAPLWAAMRRARFLTREAHTQTQSKVKKLKREH